MDHFSARLRTLRINRGWDQSELARRCGIKQGHISQLESGKRLPHTATARRLATALAVSLDELLTDPPAPSAAA